MKMNESLARNFAESVKLVYFLFSVVENFF